MNSFSRNIYVIKEKVKFVSITNHYDIFDPDTGEQILVSNEPYLSFFTKLFRFLKDMRRSTPFHAVIKDMEGNELIHVKRGWTFLRSVVQVYDEENTLIGSFKQKLISFTPKFTILDSEGNEVCELKGKWHGWNFTFMHNDKELAQITKKWAGLRKEFFSSADNYVLKINEKVPENSDTRRLILAAVMTIDLVLKE